MNNSKSTSQKSFSSSVLIEQSPPRITTKYAYPLSFLKKSLISPNDSRKMTNKTKFPVIGIKSQALSKTKKNLKASIDLLISKDIKYKRFNEIVNNKTDKFCLPNQLKEQYYRAFSQDSLGIGLVKNDSTLVTPIKVNNRATWNMSTFFIKDNWKIKDVYKGLEIKQPDNFPHRQNNDFLLARLIKNIEVEKTWANIPRPCKELIEDNKAKIENRKLEIAFERAEQKLKHSNREIEHKSLAPLDKKSLSMTYQPEPKNIEKECKRVIRNLICPKINIPQSNNLNNTPNYYITSFAETSTITDKSTLKDDKQLLFVKLSDFINQDEKKGEEICFYQLLTGLNAKHNEMQEGQIKDIQIVIVLPKIYTFGDDSPRQLKESEYSENFNCFKLDPVKIKELLSKNQFDENKKITFSKLKEALEEVGYEVGNEETAKKYKKLFEKERKRKEKIKQNEQRKEEIKSLKKEDKKKKYEIVRKNIIEKNKLLDLKIIETEKAKLKKVKRTYPESFESREIKKFIKNEIVGELIKNAVNISELNNGKPQDNDSQNFEIEETNLEATQEVTADKQEDINESINEKSLSNVGNQENIMIDLMPEKEESINCNEDNIENFPEEEQVVDKKEELGNKKASEKKQEKPSTKKGAKKKSKNKPKKLKKKQKKLNHKSGDLKAEQKDFISGEDNLEQGDNIEKVDASNEEIEEQSLSPELSLIKNNTAEKDLKLEQKEINKSREPEISNNNNNNNTKEEQSKSDVIILPTKIEPKHRIKPRNKIFESEQQMTSTKRENTEEHKKEVVESKNINSRNDEAASPSKINKKENFIPDNTNGINKTVQAIPNKQPEKGKILNEDLAIQIGITTRYSSQTIADPYKEKQEIARINTVDPQLINKKIEESSKERQLEKKKTYSIRSRKFSNDKGDVFVPLILKNPSTTTIDQKIEFPVEPEKNEHISPKRGENVIIPSKPKNKIESPGNKNKIKEYYKQSASKLNNKKSVDIPNKLNKFNIKKEEPEKKIISKGNFSPQMVRQISYEDEYLLKQFQLALQKHEEETIKKEDNEKVEQENANLNEDLETINNEDRFIRAWISCNSKADKYKNQGPFTFATMPGEFAEDIKNIILQRSDLEIKELNQCGSLLSNFFSKEKIPLESYKKFKESKFTPSVDLTYYLAPQISQNQPFSPKKHFMHRMTKEDSLRNLEENLSLGGNIRRKGNCIIPINISDLYSPEKKRLSPFLAQCFAALKENSNALEGHPKEEVERFKILSNKLENVVETLAKRYEYFEKLHEIQKKQLESMKKEREDFNTRDCNSAVGIYEEDIKPKLGQNGKKKFKVDFDILEQRKYLKQWEISERRCEYWPTNGKQQAKKSDIINLVKKKK